MRSGVREKATVITRCCRGASRNPAVGAATLGLFVGKTLLQHRTNIRIPNSRATEGHEVSPPLVPIFPGGPGRTEDDFWERGDYLLATLAVRVIDVVEAVLIYLAQPDVLPDAHEAVGVPPAVPPVESAPTLSPPRKGHCCPLEGGCVTMGDKNNKGDPIMLNRVNKMEQGSPTPPKNGG